jgi:hypothetical protein
VRQTLIVAVAVLVASNSLAETPREAHMSRAVAQAVKVGVKDCAPALEVFVKYFYPKDDVYAHLATWSQENPNGSIFDTIIVEPKSDGDVDTTFQVSKNSVGKCDIVATSAYAVPDQSCGELRETVFKEWKYYDVLSKSTVLETKDGPGEDAILTPMKNGGCLILRRLQSFGN